MEEGYKYQERFKLEEIVPSPFAVKVISNLSIDSIESIEIKNAVISYNFLCHKLNQEKKHLKKIEALIKEVTSETGVSSDNEILKVLNENKQVIEHNINDFLEQLYKLEHSKEIAYFIYEAYHEQRTQEIRDSVKRFKEQRISRQKQIAEQEAQENLQKHLDNLILQEQEFKKEIPSFNLKQELNNPEFAHLTSPYNNKTVKDAYYLTHPKKSKKKKISVAKEKILNSARTIGFWAGMLLALVISILPFVMIDVSFFWAFILIGVQLFVPATSIIFWLWGLICAIIGPQDIIAIIYYILFVIMFLPFFIYTFSDFIMKLFHRK